MLAVVPPEGHAEASLADLKQVVSLGERLATATDERSLAAMCSGPTARLLGGSAAAFVTDRVAFADGAAWDAAALEALRAAALPALGIARAAGPLESLPAPVAATVGSGRMLLAAPLSLQRELVGVLACVTTDSPVARLILSAIAQLASAYLGALRVIGTIRVEAREVEVLLEKRTRDLRAAEAHLIVSDRLAAIGTLAAGIGHEISNPLATVMLNNGALSNRLARAGLPAGVLSDAQRLLGENDEALDRIRTIVGELRTFVRKDDGSSFSPLDVRAVVESATRLARAQLRGLELQLALTPVSPVLGSQARLGQVFLNLLVNAAQALSATSRGARIDVRSEERGQEVVISVADNGPGIPPDVLPKIFDMYFTTKAGHGTGLGLSIAHDIVARHGGRIEVDSTVGVGTTFRVILPIKAPAAAGSPRPVTGRGAATPAVKPARRKPSHPGIAIPDVKRPRLLICDDEPAILRALTRELELEFEITATSSGDEATSACGTGRTFDAFLCDVNLLGESGLDVSSRVAALDPRLGQRVIFMSGGTLSDRARVAAVADPTRFVAKPFDLPALVRLLKAIAEV